MQYFERVEADHLLAFVHELIGMGRTVQHIVPGPPGDGDRPYYYVLSEG